MNNIFDKIYVNKLLNNTLWYNSYLFKFKNRSYATCNMCSKIEIVKYLLFDCEYVKKNMETFEFCYILLSNKTCYLGVLF